MQSSDSEDMFEESYVSVSESEIDSDSREGSPNIASNSGSSSENPQNFNKTILSDANDSVFQPKIKKRVAAINSDDSSDDETQNQCFISESSEDDQGATPSPKVPQTVHSDTDDDIVEESDHEGSASDLPLSTKNVKEDTPNNTSSKINSSSVIVLDATQCSNKGRSETEALPINEGDLIDKELPNVKVKTGTFDEPRTRKESSDSFETNSDSSSSEDTLHTINHHYLGDSVLIENTTKDTVRGDLESVEEEVRFSAAGVLSSTKIQQTPSSSDDDIVDISSGDEDPPVWPLSGRKMPRKAPNNQDIPKKKLFGKNLGEDLKTEKSPDVSHPRTEKLNEQTSQDVVRPPIKEANVRKSPDVSRPILKESTGNVQVDGTVSVEVYEQQKQKVEALRVDVQKSKRMMNTVNMSALPDNGEMLIARHRNLIAAAAEAEDVFSNMKVNADAVRPSEAKPVSWKALKNATSDVQPRTFGKQAMATYNAQKALTLDRLQQLHGSIKTCPTENTLAADPKGLKVELMDHQKYALGWLMWREEQKPSGGILADDMGLGKTLTMISLMLKSHQEHDDEDSDEENVRNHREQKYNGGTLVVCPASLLNQWEEEVKRHCKKSLISVEIYHGPKREPRAKSLAKYDMVITTYTICMNEHQKSSALYGVHWRRIILDEAHQVRNHKSGTSKAVCEINGKSRWALTGTPIHNKELDLYALLKFLRCSPFDDLAVWKRWVTDKSAGGQQRLHTVISSLMLRRTKEQLKEKGTLTCLPERKWELVEVKLDKPEMDVYQKILIFSRTLFAQFLHQRAERDTDYAAVTNGLPTLKISNDYNAEYQKMHRMLVKLNKVKAVKQHEILVLLLRLRQICCHPTLITGMLNNEEDVGADEEDGSDEFNILEQLNNLNLNDADHTNVATNVSIEGEAVGLAQASRGLLNPTNPIFDEERKSSKVRAIIELLKERILSCDDKAVIVSQFKRLLNIIAVHLKQDNIKFHQLDGSVDVHKRMDIVNKFNDPGHRTRVLLLSLTAGGVGLNLIGGNHLLLADLHWNPQLELQAQDRIYRVGQRKSVNVYKFVTLDTIEQRIKKLQDHKISLANSVLTGAKVQQTKLSLDDLKMLFNM